MSLLLSAGALDARRVVAASSLAPLASSLAADLQRVLEMDLHFPAEKALLTRDGGRCARDGTYLEFDPFERHSHRCPRCGAVYRGEHHDRFWIYWYQLWLAERAVHAAVLAAMSGRADLLSLAERILDGYAERYLAYPNVDNVLGPSRLFFSTYLESIWVLQIAIAVDLLPASSATLADRVRDRIVEPARSIIAEYDEGASNRQVWNDVALLATSRLLGDQAGAEAAVFGPSGIATHLANGLLPDGTWYEGENYHLFAHRGLWYGVTMAEHAGLEPATELVARFERAFATPFAAALPDFTLPSRRDSQYAISLRQWRIAEHCELGLARRDDPVLAGALRRMYDDDVPRHPTGRDRSSADVERNSPGTALSRADLSWRALLFARPELPRAITSVPASVLLESQGIGVFRREEGRVYVALDYGHSGGGHGHPDRLNLLLSVGDVRWLDDFGTGSYVDPSLHWYRSTLAHNAPLFDGHSQERVHGRLLAWDERSDVGWIAAAADEVAPGVSAARSIIVTSDYLIDCLEWSAESDATVDLPLHADLELSGVDPAEPASLPGGDGREDGFAFLRETSVQRPMADTPLRAEGTAPDGSAVVVFADASSPTEWWRGTAPGAPARGDHTFRIVRAIGDQGELRFLWTWNRRVIHVEWRRHTVLVHLDTGAIHAHTRSADGWTIRQPDLPTVVLRGLVVYADAPRRDAPVAPHAAPLSLRRGAVERVILGEAHYRRSESTWVDAGRPGAEVELLWTGASLDLTILVPRSDLAFVPGDAINPFDNEPADVNGDGIELFTRAGGETHGWMLVPERESNDVRIRSIDGAPVSAGLSARWERSGRGYRVRVSIPEHAVPSALDVLINEKPADRVRRRGQLVLSGARGEFVYLRGDRHEPHRLIPIRLTDA